MRAIVIGSGLAIVALAAIASGVVPPNPAIGESRDGVDAGREGGTNAPACILVRAEARYVVTGYRHIVALTNGCSKAATCSVATNVAPEPQKVELKSGTSLEVVTFNESPAATFVPIVSCTLAK